MALLEFAWNEHPILNISLKNLTKKLLHIDCVVCTRNMRRKRTSHIGDDSFLPIHLILRRECHRFGSGNDIMRLYKIYMYTHYISIHILFLVLKRFFCIIPSPQETFTKFTKKRSLAMKQTPHFPSGELFGVLVLVIFLVSGSGLRMFWPLCFGFRTSATDDFEELQFSKGHKTV